MEPYKELAARAGLASAPQTLATDHAASGDTLKRLARAICNGRGGGEAWGGLPEVLAGGQLPHSAYSLAQRRLDPAAAQRIAEEAAAQSRDSARRATAALRQAGAVALPPPPAPARGGSGGFDALISPEERSRLLEKLRERPLSPRRRAMIRAVCERNIAMIRDRGGGTDDDVEPPRAAAPEERRSP